MNNEVIRIYEGKTEAEKPVEFKEILGTSEYTDTNLKPINFKKVVYLGKCGVDGDMFAAYTELGNIEIFKGHINSGKY